MAKTVEAWDDPDFAEGRKTPAEHRDVEFRIGDRVQLTFDLTEAHLAELIEHNARWVALGQQVPAEVRAAVRGTRRPGPQPEYARRREIRKFAAATGRGQECIRPGWTPQDGSKNKYLSRVPEELVRDFDAWVAAGRPAVERWQRQAS